jgi:predicted transcriptional regulator
MATLHDLDVPDELYAKLQQLAKAKNTSVSIQIISILEKALPTQLQPTEDQRYQNVKKLLKEICRRRESRRTDIEWTDSTAMIQEDRNR